MHSKNRQETKLSSLLWRRLSQIHRDRLYGINDLLKEWDLSSAQMDIIRVLGEEIVITQQEMAANLHVSKGNITQLIKRLEEMKLISRKRDWKTNYISLTDKGNEIYEDLTPRLEEYQVEIFSSLTIDEKKQLLQLLKKMHI